MTPQEGERHRNIVALPREAVVFARNQLSGARVLLEERVTTPFIVNHAVPRVEKEATKAEKIYPEGFDEAFRKARVKAKGARPVLLSGHQSHADVFYTAALAQDLLMLANMDNADTPYAGFYMPVAESLGSGDQGDLLQAVYGKIQTDLGQQGFSLGEFVRKKDSAQYGMQRERNELLGLMQEAKEENYAVAMYPEGTVEHGRTNDDTNTINGFQHVGRSLHLALRKLMTNDADLIIVPMSSHGTYELYDPTEGKKRPVAKSVIKLLLNQPLDVKIRVGMPILASKMYQLFEHLPQRQIGSEVDKFVMTRVAQLYPPHIRGPYSELYLPEAEAA